MDNRTLGEEESDSRSAEEAADLTQLDLDAMPARVYEHGDLLAALAAG